MRCLEKKYDLQAYLLRLFIGLFLVWQCASVSAQPIPRRLLGNKKEEKVFKKIINDLYNLREAAVKRSLDSLQTKWTGHPALDFIEGMSLYWQERCITSKSPKYEKFERLIKKAAAEAERLYEQDPNYEWLLIAISAYSLLAERYADEKKYMATFPLAKKIYSYIKEAKKRKHESVELLTVVGLYNYYREGYPEQHPASKPLMVFFTRGDKELGLRQVKKAIDEGFLTRPEAISYLCNIYLFYENNPKKTLQFYKLLHKGYPENQYYAYKLAYTYFSLGKYEAIMPLAKKVGKSTHPYDKCAAHFLKASVKELYKRDFVSAEKHYREALRYKNSITGTAHSLWFGIHLGLARVYERRGESLLARAHFKKAIAASPFKEHKKKARQGLDVLEAREKRRK